MIKVLGMNNKGKANRNRKNKKRSRKSDKEEEEVKEEEKVNVEMEEEEEEEATEVKDNISIEKDDEEGAISSESETEEVTLKASKASKVTKAVSDGRYRNKQRCLVLSSRGVTARYRHLLEDLRKLMPHHKKDYKLDPTKSGGVSQSLTEICEVMSCNSYMYMECRKKMDAYLWLGLAPHGPSARFYIWNVHTMDELRLTGNCMKGSRPLLSFDSSFDDESLPHLQLTKILFSNVFGTPRGHPKSKPFVDRIMTFYYADQKIWVRNYQIVEEEAVVTQDDEQLEQQSNHNKSNNTSLVEIGPRFVLNPIKILSGSIRGQVLYENKTFVSPNEIRAQDKSFYAKGYEARKEWEKKRKDREENLVVVQDPLDSVFK